MAAISMIFIKSNLPNFTFGKLIIIKIL